MAKTFLCLPKSETSRSEASRSSSAAKLTNPLLSTIAQLGTLAAFVANDPRSRVAIDLHRAALDSLA